MRVIDCDGSGSMLDVVTALEWVHSNVEMPAVVLMSLGGQVAAILDAAAQSVTDIGINVVVAGGNSAAGELLLLTGCCAFSMIGNVVRRMFVPSS